jgi:hypothetical protein
MPWCHSCGAEFREGVSSCPTCNIALDAAPPDPPEEVDDDSLLDSEEELTMIGRGDFATCLDYRAAFHAAGIPCALVREEVEADAPAEARQHPRFEILVPVSRIDDVGKVLSQREASALEREGLRPIEPATDGEHCPACGAALKPDDAQCSDCGIALGG